MTELHAENLKKYQGECSAAFQRALESGDWKATETLWLKAFQQMQTVICEARNARIEADALACELLVYRPTRHERPPAPPLAGYAYVFTGQSPWVCAAVELRKLMYIDVGIGGSGYTQEHFTPEKKTVCGRKVAYPVSERFASGGWPRLHELCPDCTRSLVGSGAMGPTREAVDAARAAGEVSGG